MSLYENPFTRRCTCDRLHFTIEVCPVHGPKSSRGIKDRKSPEKRAENAEKYRSVPIGKVRHR